VIDYPPWRATIRRQIAFLSIVIWSSLSGAIARDAFTDRLNVWSALDLTLAYLTIWSLASIVIGFVGEYRHRRGARKMQAIAVPRAVAKARQEATS
jgi:hypothetical protein